MSGGSEAGIMSGRESSFGISLQKNSSHHPSQSPGGGGVMPNMRLAYSADGTAVYKPVMTNSPPPPSYQATGNSNNSGGSGDGNNNSGSIIQHGINMNMSGGVGVGGVGEPMKRKRGRPRKYGPDGTMALALSPVAAASTSPSPPPLQQQPPVSQPLQQQQQQQPKSEFSPSMAAAATNNESSMKKARGRPPGSANKKHQQVESSMGSAGLGFTPHVITVKAGEDVSSKIMSFSQNGPRAVCILSANGAISNVTLRQAATSGGTVTYEGRFEILSLSGSFLLSESGGQRSRTGGLSVSLAGPDGRVLGGGVAGLLTAASPIQVVVGSFLADTRKESKSLNHLEPSSAPSKFPYSGGAVRAGSPPSRGTMSGSSGGAGSPLNHSTGACNNNASGMSNMPWK